MYEEILPHEDSVLPFQAAWDNMIEVGDRISSFGVLPLWCGYENSDDCFDDEDILVNIKLQSSAWDFNSTSMEFSLPIQVISSREREMFLITKARGESWKESYIMQKIKLCLSRMQAIKLRRNKSMVEDWYSFNHHISVNVDIDEVSNSHDSCKWHPYLIHSIRRYYATGEISITENMYNEGYDVLFAFKCLDIVYEDKVITFDSFTTSLLSKTWQSYYENREMIAKWLKRELKYINDPCHTRKSMAFVTSPMSNGFDIYFAEADIKCEVLNMSTASEQSYHDGE
jgi:hypothetical protein